MPAPPNIREASRDPRSLRDLRASEIFVNKAAPSTRTNQDPGPPPMTRPLMDSPDPPR